MNGQSRTRRRAEGRPGLSYISTLLIVLFNTKIRKPETVHSDRRLLAGVWGWKGGVRAAVTAPSRHKPRVQTPRPQPPTDTPRLVAGRAERGWRLIWPAWRPLIRYRKHK
jgi:hypothetical protein